MAAEGTVRIISRLSGTIVKAKGLLNTKLLGKGAPRCYVKGIKGNSHLVDLFCTEVGEGQNPQWDETWSFDCLKTRSREEFVGLKFIVCDGDDFLGGADFDLSQLSAYKEAVEEMELMGVVFGKVKGTQPRKARLFITCSVDRRFMPVFPLPQTSLMDSLGGIARVASICGRIVRAGVLQNPRPKMGLSNKKRSWPMCYVRCYMMSGKILTVHTTKAVSNIAHPDWDEIFTFDFDDQSDQPIMLMFDMKGTASKPAAQLQEIWNNGDHLGSCMLIVDSLKDENAYANGEGRMRLPILGDFQQIENRLEKETVFQQTKDARVKEDDDHGPKITWKKKVDAIVDAFGFGAKRTKVVPDSFLTVQLFAERENLPMPHYKLIDEPIVVEQMELDQKPDAELQKYFERVDEAGETVKRLEITARERIVTIYGRVQAAADLIAADITGKSDPYVIVEALTKTGELLFVFRTRFIPSNLNPTWGEAFFWRVPPDPDNPLLPVVLSKLTFSVYDSDEGQIMEMVGGGDDDFLGRCGVDISTMRNNDAIAEDIPLLGVKARPGGFKSGGGFRRYSTVSVDIRVERRVHRIIDTQHHYDPCLLDVPRHHPSRPMLTAPTVKPYKDFSQEVTESKQESFDNTAGKVLRLRDSNKLAKLSNPARWKEICGTEGQGWLQTRPVTSPFVAVTSPVLPNSRRSLQDRESDEGNVAQSDVSHHRRNWVALRENWNGKLIGAQASNTLNYETLNYVNRLPPMERTTSAPIILGTRFGQNYAKMTSNPFEDPIKKALKHIPPRMLPAGTGSEVATTKLTSKPALDLYSTRVRDVHTAPARLSGPL